MKASSIYYLILVILSVLTITPLEVLHAEEDKDLEVVYLDLIGCEVCDRIKDHGVISGLEEQGVNVIIYDVRKDPLISDQYAFAYGIRGGRAAPIIFAGDVYFRGADDIIEAFENGDILYHAQYPLRDLDDYQPRDFTFLTGLIFVMITGLLDGINPCAIAMLLMFISMIGFTKNAKIMLVVSISYISAIFITYLAIGIGFLTILGLSQTAFGNISIILYSFFALLTFFLAVITFYDFIVTRNQRYDKVKNQLPGYIRKLNERIMTKFTKILEEKQNKRKAFLWFILIPAFIGVLVGITEAACTGQIYIAVLASLEASMTTGLNAIKMFYLIVFNIMFIFPLLIIAFIAIKTQTTVGVANFIRENMPKIKLATSVFFFFMAIYFVLMILGIELIRFEFTL